MGTMNLNSIEPGFFDPACCISKCLYQGGNVFQGHFLCNNPSIQFWYF